MHVIIISHFDNVYTSMLKLHDNTGFASVLRQKPPSNSGTKYQSPGMLVPVVPIVTFSLILHEISHVCSKSYQLHVV
jgi:hypothetical protein